MEHECRETPSYEESCQWKTIRSYYASNDLDESKKQSNCRLLNNIPKVIKSHSPLVVKGGREYHFIYYDRVTMNLPMVKETDGTFRTLDPRTARLRQENYKNQFYVHARHEVYLMETDDEVAPHVVLEKGQLTSRKNYPYLPFAGLAALTNSMGCCKVHSGNDFKECRYDTGSYYIVAGAEKALMYRERPAHNRILLFPRKDTGEFYAEYRAEYPEAYRSTETLELNYTKANKSESESLWIRDIPWVTYLRALGMERADYIYNWCRFIAGRRWNEKFESCFHGAIANDEGIVKQDAAFSRIGLHYMPASMEKTSDSIREYGRTYLLNRFLPNMGNVEQNFLTKAIALIVIACDLIQSVHDPSIRTNKDDYRTKDTESVEDLIGNKFREALDSIFHPHVRLSMIKRLKDRKSIDLYEIYNDDKIGEALNKCISTGVWHLKKNKVTQTGVSQKMDRNNYICTQAQKMKVISKLNKEIKQVAPRLVQATSFGIMCPADSPEGEVCGLVKFHAMMQHLSLATNGNTIRHLLANKLGVVEFNKLTQENLKDAVANNKQYVIVNVNGIPLGIYHDPVKVCEFVQQQKLSLNISGDTGFSFTNDKVDIRTGRGRSMRPLFVAKNLHKLNRYRNVRQSEMDWNTLLAEGIIEYVDKEQENNLLIATDLDKYLERNTDIDAATGKRVIWDSTLEFSQVFTKPGCPVPTRFTHVELHGSVFYGLSASMIPFPEHNQSPRNSYQCVMVRQAQGLHSSNTISERMDCSSMELWHSQSPIVETEMHNIMHCQKFPYGSNLIIAVMSTGWKNQDDANANSQAAVDFGAMRSTIRRSITVSEKKQSKAEHHEVFQRVPEEQMAGRKRADFHQLEDDGTIRVGAPTNSSTIYVQKVTKLKDPIVVPNKKIKLDYLCKSVSNTLNVPGRIDRVLLTSTACGVRTAKIRTRYTAFVENGDKFALRPGQKGITNSRPTVDMIYTEDGVIPHWIINSLAFTSRMTWGLFLEILFATVCAMNGRFGNATPFSKMYRESLYRDMEQFRAKFKPSNIVQELRDALRHLGFDNMGQHVVYNGRDGSKCECEILMGLAFQQRLKHMVNDKIRARARGKKNTVTGQATEGKNKDGGLKVGEMERDCLVAHGASHTLADRMHYTSDAQPQTICQSCGIPSTREINTQDVWCSVCDSYDSSIHTLGSATFNTFCNELTSANIAIKYETEQV